MQSKARKVRRETRRAKRAALAKRAAPLKEARMAKATSMTPTREITTKLAAKVPGKARLLEMTPTKEKVNHPLRTLSSMVHAATVANMAISSRTAGGRDLTRYLQQDRSRPKPQRLQALR
jgi:hypothetical protein